MARRFVMDFSVKKDKKQKEFEIHTECVRINKLPENISENEIKIQAVELAKNKLKEDGYKEFLFREFKNM